MVVVVVPLTDGDPGHGRRRRSWPGWPDGALLVNAARGPVADTGAVLAELQSGRLRAALDVTDPEPLPADHPLWDAPEPAAHPARRRGRGRLPAPGRTRWSAGSWSAGSPASRWRTSSATATEPPSPRRSGSGPAAAGRREQRQVPGPQHRQPHGRAAAQHRGDPRPGGSAARPCRSRPAGGCRAAPGRSARSGPRPPRCAAPQASPPTGSSHSTASQGARTASGSMQIGQHRDGDQAIRGVRTRSTGPHPATRSPPPPHAGVTRGRGTRSRARRRAGRSPPRPAPGRRTGRTAAAPAGAARGPSRARRPRTRAAPRTRLTVPTPPPASHGEPRILPLSAIAHAAASGTDARPAGGNLRSRERADRTGTRSRAVPRSPTAWSGRRPGRCCGRSG